MIYDETTAKAIVAKYGLSPSTLKVWKYRNSIPDKYSEPGYQKRTALTPAQELTHATLMKVLSSGKVKIKAFGELTGISEQKFRDANRKGEKQVQLSQADLKRAVAKLKEIRLQISKTFESYQETAFTNLLKNPCLAYSIIAGEREIYSKLSDYRRGKTQLTQETWQKAKDKYFVFALELGKL